METLLPSEVARLVLGYLEEEKCETVAKKFLETSENLSEIRKLVQIGRKYPTRVNGYSLSEVIDEYCLVHTIVQECMQKLPSTVAEQLKQCGSMIERLRHLVSGCSCQRVKVNITLHPHQQGLTTTPTAGQHKSILDSGSEPLTSTPRARSRKSLLHHGLNLDQPDPIQNSQALPGTAVSVEPSTISATPVESLPGHLTSTQPQQSVQHSQHENTLQPLWVQQKEQELPNKVQQESPKVSHHDSPRFNGSDDYSASDEMGPLTQGDDALQVVECEVPNPIQDNRQDTSSCQANPVISQQSSRHDSNLSSSDWPVNSMKAPLPKSESFTVVNHYGSSILILNEDPNEVHSTYGWPKSVQSPNEHGNESQLLSSNSSTGGNAGGVSNKKSPTPPDGKSVTPSKSITDCSEGFSQSPSSFSQLAQMVTEHGDEIQPSAGVGNTVGNSDQSVNERSAPARHKNTPSKVLAEGSEEREGVDVEEMFYALLENNSLHEKLADNITRTLNSMEITGAVIESESKDREGEVDENVITTIVQQTVQQAEPVFEEFLEEFLMFSEQPVTDEAPAEPNVNLAKNTKKKKRSAKVKSSVQPSTSNQSVLRGKTPLKDEHSSAIKITYNLPLGSTPAKPVTGLNDMTPVSKLIHDITNRSGEFYLEPTQFAQLVDIGDGNVQGIGHLQSPMKTELLSSSTTSHHNNLTQLSSHKAPVPATENNLQDDQQKEALKQQEGQYQQQLTRDLPEATAQQQQACQPPQPKPQQQASQSSVGKSNQKQLVHIQPKPHPPQAFRLIQPTQIVQLSQPNGTTVNVPVIVCNTSQEIAQFVNQQGTSTLCEGVFQVVPSNPSCFQTAPDASTYGNALLPVKGQQSFKSEGGAAEDGMITMYSAEGVELTSTVAYSTACPVTLREGSGVSDSSVNSPPPAAPILAIPCDADTFISSLTPSIEEQSEKGVSHKQQACHADTFICSRTPSVKEQSEKGLSLNQEACHADTFVSSITPSVEEQSEKGLSLNQEACHADTFVPSITPSIKEQSEEGLSLNQVACHADTFVPSITPSIKEQSEEGLSLNQEACHADTFVSSITPSVEEQSEEGLSLKQEACHEGSDNAILATDAVANVADTFNGETEEITENEVKAMDEENRPGTSASDLATSSTQEDLIMTESSLLRNTPGFHASAEQSRPKRLSLSTPRRRKSHIRALDFSTPPKERSQSSRKANTSPKNISSCALSPRSENKTGKSGEKPGLFKPPAGGGLRTSKVKAHLFKSPEYILSSSSGYKAPVSTLSVTTGDNSVPIATRTPGEKLSSAWDRVGGVGLILNAGESPVHPQDPPSPKPKLRSWDSDLRSLIGTTEVSSPPKAAKRKRKNSSPSKQKKTKPAIKKVKKDVEATQEPANVSAGSEGELARQIEERIMNDSTESIGTAIASQELPDKSKSGIELPTKEDTGNESHDQTDDSERNITKSSPSRSTSNTISPRSEMLDIEDKITTYVIEKEVPGENGDTEGSVSDESFVSLNRLQVNHTEQCADHVVKSQKSATHPSQVQTDHQEMNSAVSNPCREDPNALNTASCVDPPNTNSLDPKDESTSSKMFSEASQDVFADGVPSKSGKDTSPVSKASIEIPTHDPAVVLMSASTSDNEGLSHETGRDPNEADACSQPVCPLNEKNYFSNVEQSKAKGMDTEEKILTPEPDLSNVLAIGKTRVATSLLSFDTPLKTDINMIPHTPRILSPNSACPEDTPMTKLIRSHIPVLSENSIQTPSLPPTPTIKGTPTTSPNAASQLAYFEPRPFEGGSPHAMDTSLRNCSGSKLITPQNESASISKCNEVIKSNDKGPDSTETPMFGCSDGDSDVSKKAGNRRRSSGIGKQGPTNLSKKFQQSTSETEDSAKLKSNEGLTCARVSLVKRKLIERIKSAEGCKSRWITHIVCEEIRNKKGTPDKTKVSQSRSRESKDCAVQSKSVGVVEKISSRVECTSVKSVLPVEDIGTKECETSTAKSDNPANIHSKKIKEAWSKVIASKATPPKDLGMELPNNPDNLNNKSKSPPPSPILSTQKEIEPMRRTPKKSQSPKKVLRTSADAVDQLLQNARNELEKSRSATNISTTSTSSSDSSSSSDSDTSSSSSSSDEDTPVKKPVSPRKEIMTPKTKLPNMTENNISAGLEEGTSVCLVPPQNTSTPVSCSSAKRSNVVSIDHSTPEVPLVSETLSGKKFESNQDKVSEDNMQCLKMVTDSSDTHPVAEKGSSKVLNPLYKSKDISTELDEKRKRMIAHMKNEPYVPATLQESRETITYAVSMSVHNEVIKNVKEGASSVSPSQKNEDQQLPPQKSPIKGQSKSFGKSGCTDQLSRAESRCSDVASDLADGEDFPRLHISSDEREDTRSCGAQEPLEKELAALHGVDTDETLILPQKQTTNHDHSADKDLGLTTPKSDIGEKIEKPLRKRITISSVAADRVLKTVLEQGLGKIQAPPRSKIQKLAPGSATAEHKQESIISTTKEPPSVREKSKSKVKKECRKTSHKIVPVGEEDLDYECEGHDEASVAENGQSMNTSSPNCLEINIVYKGPQRAPSHPPIQPSSLMIRFVLDDDRVAQFNDSPLFTMYEVPPSSKSQTRGNASNKPSESKGEESSRKNGRDYIEKSTGTRSKSNGQEKNCHSDDKSSSYSKRRQSPSPSYHNSRSRRVSDRMHSPDRRDHRKRESRNKSDSDSRSRHYDHVSSNNKKSDRGRMESEQSHSRSRSVALHKNSAAKDLSREEGEISSGSDLDLPRKRSRSHAKRKQTDVERSKSAKGRQTPATPSLKKCSPEYTEADFDRELAQFGGIIEDSDTEDKDSKPSKNKVESSVAPQRRAPPRSVNAHKVAALTSPPVPTSMEKASSDRKTRSTNKRKKPVSPSAQKHSPKSSEPGDKVDESKQPSVSEVTCDVKKDTSTNSPPVKKVKGFEVQDPNQHSGPKDTLRKLDIDAFLSKIHGSS